MKKKKHFFQFFQQQQAGATTMVMIMPFPAWKDFVLYYFPNLPIASVSEKILNELSTTVTIHNEERLISLMDQNQEFMCKNINTHTCPLGRIFSMFLVHRCTNACLWILRNIPTLDANLEDFDGPNALSIAIDYGNDREIIELLAKRPEVDIVTTFRHDGSPTLTEELAELIIVWHPITDVKKEIDNANEALKSGSVKPAILELFKLYAQDPIELKKLLTQKHV